MSGVSAELIVDQVIAGTGAVNPALLHQTCRTSGRKRLYCSFGAVAKW